MSVEKNLFFHALHCKFHSQKKNDLMTRLEIQEEPNGTNKKLVYIYTKTSGLKFMSVVYYWIIKLII